MSKHTAANSCSASCCALASAKLVNKGDQPERQEPAIHVEHYACTCSRYAGHSSCWQRRGTSQDCGFGNQRVAIWDRTGAGWRQVLLSCLATGRGSWLISVLVRPKRARCVKGRNSSRRWSGTWN